MTDPSNQFEKSKKDAGPIERLDLEIVKRSEPLGDQPVIAAIGRASDLADQPPLITASLVTAGIGLLARDRRLAKAGLRMLAAHVAATGIKTLIKDNFDRPRPDKVEREGKHDVKEGHSQDGEERSLPSGHSAGAFAVARAVARDYPGASMPAHMMAMTAAAVQVPRKSHFPSDVLLGSLVGILAEFGVSLVIDAIDPRVVAGRTRDDVDS